MRVILATFAEKTNFLGMVPLGWALQNAGHEVRVVTQPELIDTVTATGLTAVPVGSDNKFWRVLRAMPEFDMHRDEVPPFSLFQDPGTTITWEALHEGFSQVVPWWWRMINEPMTEDLVDFCRQWQPDLVIWEAVTFAGPIAAKAVGCAHARFMWSVDMFGELRRHYLHFKSRQPPGRRDDPHAAWLDSQARRYGTTFSEDMAVGQFTLDHLPAPLRMDAGLDYLPMRYIPYNGRAVVPRWLHEPPARPRVCLTLGTSATERTGGYAVDLQGLLHSLGEVDAEIVATVPEDVQSTLEHVPDNTRLVDYVPLNAIVPTCAAVINHGGPGTLFTSLVHGVPQLVLPHMFDAPVLARMLTGTGAGLSLPQRSTTGPEVRAHLERLLYEPSYLEAARGLRNTVQAMPTPDDVVPLIEEKAAQGGLTR